ncbi:hypothetical protein KR026_010391 [Drosophila bipectinata]|nr:hypothetical protein KR026_010391 [Drosophila bipectinata]
MFDWDGWLLKVVYYYGFLVGISNFEVDWNRCRVFKTRRSTIFAIVHNVLAWVLVLNYWKGRVSFNVLFGKANKLHEYVVVIMSGLRVVSGLLTIATRWRRRRQIMRILRRLFRLYLAKPQVKRMSRRAILIKFLNVCITDLLQIALGLDALHRVGPDLILGMALQFCMVSLMTVAISQYYLVMLFIRTQYVMLNSELRSVMEEARGLRYRPHRNGVFMTKCCDLSDRLDDLAQQQDEIQSIVASIAGAFGMQGLLVYTAYYLSAISTAYLTYSLVKHGIENLGMTLGTVAVSLTWCFFYYVDALRNLFVVLSIQNEHRTLIRIIEERTVFLPGLDIRLELSFENFQFQLIRNPFTMSVMKIFPINHGFTTLMFASLFMNSIYLIQYDMANF